jgi:hypothetical protein
MYNLTLEDIVGYVGTVAVVLSFLITDFTKFRIANIIACGIFIWYGYLTKTTPTIIVNTLIVLLNLYHLFKNKFGRTK